jgi:hypothetical protein
MKKHTKQICDNCGFSYLIKDYRPPSSDTTFVGTCPECEGTSWTTLKTLEPEQELNEGN